jgi:hypothetical protein
MALHTKPNNKTRNQQSEKSMHMKSRSEQNNYGNACEEAND